MIVAAFIPFFLTMLFPIEDTRYKPEYIFAVRMNMTGTPQCPHQDATCGDPTGYDFVYQLHCIPKRNDTLICRLKYVNGSVYGVINEEIESRRMMNRRRYLTEAPIELSFDEEGIESITADESTWTYDLNILRMIVEQLHSGDSFNDIGDGIFDGETTSNVGKCRVTFNVHNDLTNEKPKRKFPYNVRLKLLPPILRMIFMDTLVIEKITNLNDCSYYADSYFGRYGDTVKHRDIQSGLDCIVSRMEISETSFSSSTARKGTVNFKNKTYDMIEVTEIILTDIKPAPSELPVIMNRARTKIVANDYVF